MDFDIIYVVNEIASFLEDKNWISVFGDIAIVRKPAESKYNGCCNEFWWCLNNVAKGIVRDQLPYAMRIYHEIVHVELDKCLGCIME